MSRNVASDETLDAWIALPPDDLRTIEEFAEQSNESPTPAERLNAYEAAAHVAAVRSGGPSVAGRIVTTQISTSAYMAAVVVAAMPEPPSVRLLRAIAHHKPLGRPERIRVSPEVGEEIEVEIRENIWSGGHVMPNQPGEWAFRGVPVKVDHMLTGAAIQTD
jgi:hypothetical protein